MNTKPIDVPCQMCGARAGEQCYSVSTTPRRPISIPHVERRARAIRTVYPEGGPVTGKTE